MSQYLPGGAPDIDVEALREKYRVERDRRLRADGATQYIPATGAFARYKEDIWAEPGFERAALSEAVEVLVVGGGFGGLLAGARLTQAGITNFRIVEKAADFGGTWYWNRYPGAACDTESYIYLPLLEETGYIPKRKYARAPEIFEHARRIGRHFDLYERALFRTVVSDMRWDEADGRWVVSSDRGDVFRARYVIISGGTLHHPKLPGIPGVETFKGHSFHTGRWDYDYTGGGPDGGLTGLADKRVGVIGTGATAVQCIPHLGRSAKELYVFQRTPSAVDVRNDHPTDPKWAASLKPGWQHERMNNFTAVISGADFDEDMVNDGWTDLIGGILLAARRAAAAGEVVEAPEKLVDLADFQKMERIRARIDEIVRDPAAAEALKPWYNVFCKRPCFHDEYLPTFNLPNVHLVDTHGKGVERITEKGVVVDGREYELDCLIYATGFEVGGGFQRQLGFEILGRDGVSLTEAWANGAGTLHGYTTRGFPNLFLMAGVQAGQSANFQHMLDEQARHIVHVLSRLVAQGANTVEPSAQAQADWTHQVVRAARGRLAFLETCTPGYYNNEGAGFDERTAKNGPFWRGPVAFIRMIEQWRADERLEGLEVT